MNEPTHVKETIHIPAQQALHRYESELEPRQVARLAEVRVEALIAPARIRRQHLRPTWGLAVASVLFFVILGPTSLYDTSFGKPPPIVSGNIENLDLYEELEFYQWYAAQESAGGI